MKVEIFDSTLRDGAQGEGISFSVQDKLKIVKTLDEFGVTYIEAGNPSSNPKEMLFFKELKKINLNKSKICAFGSTVRSGSVVSEDSSIQSLLDADTDVVTIFGKTWDLHVTEILQISLEDNLKIVYDTINYLKGKGKEVIFDAEHFFDGYKNNEEYALKVLDSAEKAGADCICLCDTNGGTLPQEIEQITRKTMEKLNVKIAIHCHDDSGCAVASSLAAVSAGAVQVQGTLIGFGERCGNANLSAIIPNLMLKCGYECDVRLAELKKTARKIAGISNTVIRSNSPYIGKSAFSHKGGMHIDGVQKLTSSFEHIDPKAVGNERKFLLSEVSGRGTVLPRIQRFVPYVTKNSPITSKITEELKKQELIGYQYESAEASFELFVKKLLGQLSPHFNVIMYKVTDDFSATCGEATSKAVVKVEVNGKTELMSDMGKGPVNALDKALRRALCVFYPEINNVHFIDYKVRVIETRSSDARIRVLIESTDEDGAFTTIGVSNDVIEASFIALVDSFEYRLSKGE